MRNRDRPLGRETDIAATGRRRIWYGYGSMAHAEKSGIGRFLDDTTRLYAEVSVFSLPVLLFIMSYPATSPVDAKATGFVGWMTMTLVGALIRGGWVRPLATDSLGWVRLSPWLLVLRVGYVPAAFALATFGGLVVAGLVGSVAAGLLWAAAVAAVAMGLFPSLASRWLAWVRERTA